MGLECVVSILEYLNVQLFEVAKTYYSALAKIDTNKFESSSKCRTQKQKKERTSGSSSNPKCEHNTPSKLVQVKKEGRNKVGPFVQR